jgi:hypothetical protein
MQTLPRNVNPFALMLDPQAVIAQIERSERLEGLHRRVCRPLDKPLLGGSVDEASDNEASDNEGMATRAADAEDAMPAEHSTADQMADGQFCGDTRHD